MSDAVLNDDPARAALDLIDVQELPPANPVRKLNECYMQLRLKCDEQRLPQLQDLLEAVDDGLTEYCLVLLPIPGQPFIDFQVLHRGTKIPGSDLASFKYGERYTDHILEKFASERLMELASCLALKKCRFSRTRSARRSSLDVTVFRAVLPIWVPEHQIHGIILVIAPAAI